MRYLILAALLVFPLATYAQDADPEGDVPLSVAVPVQDDADLRAEDLEMMAPSEPLILPVDDAALAVENEGGNLRFWLDGAGALIVPGTFVGDDGNVPVSGDGVRLMWIPERAAFRAGRAGDVQAWDSENTGNYSTAFGLGTTASGRRSTAMGDGTTASGFRSTAVGYETLASGQEATAMGWQTTASGFMSTAMGSQTTASGITSTAIGTQTEAEGTSSLAAGYRAGALGDGTFVWADRSSTDRFESTAVNRFLIRAANGVGIGTAIPNSALHVRADRDTQNLFRAQDSDGYTGLLVAANRGASIGISALSPPERGLYVWGDVGIGTSNPADKLHVIGTVRANGFNNVSDARLKTAVAPLTGAVAAITGLAGVRYEWNADLIAEDASLSGTQIGFLAQDVREILPELVREGADGSLAVSYSQMVPVLVEALKEQQTEIEALEARLEHMERMMEMMASRD